MSSDLLLSFYGDDFTGSTDAMEALSLAGIRTVLFLDPPSPALLHERFAGVEAVGVAGVSRRWTPAQMEAGLRPIFAALRDLGAPLVHYKVCSTFDSSPEIGSIGRAIDIGRELFASGWVPLVVGAPVLRRYTLFGNLFATVGDETFRLDRHPTMSRHPITPMHESDLRVHLGRQTNASVALFEILQLAGIAAEVDRRLDALLDTGPDVVLFDVLDQARLVEVGRLIHERAGAEPLFVVGSSGLEYALAAHWQASGRLPQPAPPTPAEPVAQVVVVSGSCSPETQRQIAWAVAQGYVAVALDTARLLDPDHADAERDRAIHEALAALQGGLSVVVHSCLGPHDPRIAAAASYTTSGEDGASTGATIGTHLGEIMHTLLLATGVRRAIVAGGDTSGYVAHHLGIFALEMVTPTAPGSPLCRAFASDRTFDGLEIALKGGQVGKADYFERVRRGSA